MSRISRRRLLGDTAALTSGIAARAAADVPAAQSRQGSFASRWGNTPDRVWIGPEYWAAPLQDWRVADGRAECIREAPDRALHLLTRQLGERDGELQMSVRVGRAEGGSLAAGMGSAGFRVGITGPLREYRNSLFFGAGLDAGIGAGGRLFIGGPAQAGGAALAPTVESVDLRLEARPGDGGYRVVLSAHDPASGRLLARTERGQVPAERLAGGVALVANYGPPAAGGAPRQRAAAGAGGGRFWFADWRLAGSRVEAHDERAFGPILFSQYTLSGGVLKLTAQMPPLGAGDAGSVRLQVRGEGAWSTLAEERIHPEARTATFRIEKWDDRRDVPYRLAYSLTWKDGRRDERYWTGRIRKDPVDRPVLTVADISCNVHAAFPNAGYTAVMAKLNPDLLAFVGDQFYESTAGYGVQRSPLDAAILDYLRKWYAHGWTWRELMRDRPSISIPDDHDVYQGNIWGEAGGARQGSQERGGYDMPAAWVNVVHRTQTAHHPDPFDAAPVRQGISVYFGALTYGRVSFAILADRMFKSGPEGKVPPTGGRGDHVKDPGFDPKTADLPGLELLGERQMAFLRHWAEDWRGADMKAAISQTIFTAMATTHGGSRERLRADYDSNAWPQSQRNAALRELRKAFAVHLAGDQHLPAVVHYGIDRHRDAGVAFAGPAVNVGYPRWWEPAEPGRHRAPGAAENTGDFIDHFGHPLTVLAVANGAVQPRRPVLEAMADRASGIGLARFDRARRRVTFECWPFLADAPGAAQFPGWPVVVDVLAACGPPAAAHLPTIEIRGSGRAVVRVSAGDGTTLYSVPAPGRSFRPHAPAPGRYTVRVTDPESGRFQELKDVEALPDNRETVRVSL